MRALLGLGLGLGLALLAGCAAPPTAPPQGFSGKLGYRLEATPTQRAQAGSALFELEGGASTGRLLLTSPLGTALAEASWNARGAWLKTQEGERAYASLDELGLALGQTLQGPPLPLMALFDWLQGRPWPQAGHQLADGVNRGFSQLGWRVEHRPPQLVLTQAGMSLRLILTP